MLKIEAIIRTERINHVTEALVQVGCGGFHYHNVTGQGQQRGVEVFTGRGGTMAKAAVVKTLLTTVIPDSMKDAVVEAIISATRTPPDGLIGDGKILISLVADAGRVRTGETGDTAI